MFIIDFVNDPETVRQAFAKYDDGAVIDGFQDLNVVLRSRNNWTVRGFTKPRITRASRKLASRPSATSPMLRSRSTRLPMYAATERPTRLFNQRLKMLREGVETQEAAFEKARKQGNKDGMQAADHHRHEFGDQIRTLMGFKSSLGRFCRTYAYVAQLIDLGDPALENFAAFAKLLQKRLNGEPPESVDLKGLVRTGFDIKQKEDTPDEDADKPVPVYWPRRTDAHWRRSALRYRNH